MKKSTNTRKQTIRPNKGLDVDGELVFQALENPAFVLDPHHKILSANAAALQVTGKPLSQLIGSACYRVLHDKDAPHADCPLKKVLTSGRKEITAVPVEMLKASFRVACTPLFNKKGQLEKILHVLTDLTEQKRAQELLEETQQHASLIATLIENSSQAFAILYPDGRLGICNKAFYELLGYPKQELLSLNWMREITPPQSLKREKALLEELHRTGRPIRYEKEFIRKDNLRVQAELLVHLVKNGGHPRYYYAFVTNITERKQAELRLTKLNDCLLSFGVDPLENINRLVKLCGGQLDAAYALYNRLENGMLYTWGQWNTPTDFLALKKVPDGLLCHETIRDPDSGVKIIRDLQDSPYAAMDPNIRRHELQTYVGKAVSLENVHVGSLCVVYLTDHAFTKKDEQFLEIVASAIGVEEMRKAAKDSLVESESRLALSLQAASLGVWDRDVKRNALTWDDRMYQIYGLTRDEFAGTFEAWLARLHPDDRSGVIELHNAALRGETEYRAEYRIVRPDGSLRYIKVDGLVLRNVHGDAVRVLGLNRDVTEQKLAEMALVYAEKKFRGLLEAIHLLAMILDPDGKIVFCNDYFLEITGWSREEVLGKNWIEMFVPADSRDMIRTFFRENLASGSLPSHYEHSLVTREGAIRLVVWDNALLHSPEGAIIGLASIGTDVTEHRKLEEQLRQAQKLEAIGQLSGGVAHDFNNILSAIVGYAHLALMKMTPDDPFRSNIEFILEASDRATTLTRSLLSFSRKQVINPQPHNLNEIVKKLQTFLARLIREDISIITSYTDCDLPVLADRSQIEQLIMNLVTNARDAMPSGGHLSIRTGIFHMDGGFVATHGYGKPGTYAYLTVSDTGDGIDGKTKQRIFEPFFTTKEPGKGTGLGLAMVYGAVKQHGGYVDVESEPGKGATFKIYLPLISGFEEEQKKKEEAAQHCAGSETILLAEDNSVLRDLSSRILREQGYTVITAVDGEDAIAKYQANKAQVALCIFDVIMPKKNGKEAYTAIRSINPAAKAIFVSGYAEDIISKEGMLEPGIHFILKPIPPAVLLKTVREVLDACS